MGVIDIKKHGELEIQAKLQGRELAPRLEYIDVSVEDEKIQEDEAMDAVARLQKAYEERKNKKG